MEILFPWIVELNSMNSEKSAITKGMLFQEYAGTFDCTSTRLGYMKDALLGVLTLQSIQQSRVHSKYDTRSNEK